MIRSILAIVVGSAVIFALGGMGAAVVFHDRGPALVPSVPLLLLLLVMRALAAIAGGYAAAALARRRPLVHGVLAGSLYVSALAWAPDAVVRGMSMPTGQPLAYGAVAVGLALVGGALGGLARAEIRRGGS